MVQHLTVATYYLWICLDLQSSGLQGKSYGLHGKGGMGIRISRFTFGEGEPR